MLFKLAAFSLLFALVCSEDDFDSYDFSLNFPTLPHCKAEIALPTEGLIAAESVRHDEIRDMYYVSNTFGGFISLIVNNAEDETSVITARFIDNINSPRGLSLTDSNQRLWVSAGAGDVLVYDVSVIESPNLLQTIHVLDGAFMNGSCKDRKEKFVYVTHPGFDFRIPFQKFPNDGLWRISTETFELEQLLFNNGWVPNGCTVDKQGHVWVAESDKRFGNNQGKTIRVYDAKSKELTPFVSENADGSTTEINPVDGLAFDDDDNLFISTEANNKFVFDADGTKYGVAEIGQGEILMKPKNSKAVQLYYGGLMIPADISYDAARNHLLMPVLFGGGAPVEPWKSWPKLFALDLNCGQTGSSKAFFYQSEKELFEDIIVQFWKKINTIINGRRDAYDLAFGDDLSFFYDIFEPDIAIQVMVSDSKMENYVGFRDFEFNFLRRLINGGKNVVDCSSMNGATFENSGRKVVMPVSSNLVLTDGIGVDVLFQVEWYFVKRDCGAKIKAIRLLAGTENCS